jgi:hypothetical protein
MPYSKLLTILPVLLFLSAPTPVRADEMDALLLVEEGAPLREAWEECAASFAKARLQSKQASDSSAAEAFRTCRSDESKLRNFLAKRVGKEKAQGVIELLKNRYQSDLEAAIGEMRRN